MGNVANKSRAIKRLNKERDRNPPCPAWEGLIDAINALRIQRNGINNQSKFYEGSGLIQLFNKPTQLEFQLPAYFRVFIHKVVQFV